MSDSDDCRSVLIEVLTILAKDLDKFVVVGGWVPELAMPGQGHMGSLDVDLALDPKKLEPLVYESIRKKLIDAGYQQAAELPSRFFRDVKDGALQVKIDLITGEFPNLGEQGRQLQIQDMAVSRLRGIELAFEFQQGVEVEGVLPTGGHNRVVARLPTIPAFLCIKAIAMSERMKPKDAYDIYFCVDNYSGGYKALANEFRATLSHPLIREGISILRDRFGRVDSVGPVWAARVAGETSSGTAVDVEIEERRAYELVNGLLNEVDAH